MGPHTTLATTALLLVAVSGLTDAPPDSTVSVQLERVPVRTADGRTGWASFDLTGATGRTTTGRMVLVLTPLGAPAAEAVRTEMRVSQVTLQTRETDYAFVMVGMATEAGAGRAATRRFSSTLTLARSASASRPSHERLEVVPHTITYTQLANGDEWIIDGLRCTWDQGDLVCL